MLLTYDISCTLNNLLWQTYLTSDLHSKTTTGLSYRQLKQWFQLSSVIQHRTIDNTLATLCKMLKIGIVSGYHTIGFLLVELSQYCLCYSASNHWFGSCTKLINQKQGFAISISHKVLHVAKV